jgi:hypothetical protein
MSNTLFRKGLVFGTVAALATSALVGTPAFAADEVVFAPTTGTSYRTLSDQTFSLSASLAPGQVAGNAVQIKYLIEATSGAVRYLASTAATPIVTAGAVAAGQLDTASAAQVVASGATAVSSNVLSFALKASDATTATTAVKVTAFVDSNNDSLLTAGEFNTVRTVTFVKYSEVVPTVAFSSTPSVGDTTLKATVALADINTQQLTAASYLAAFTATTVSAGTAFLAVADVQLASGAATSAALTSAGAVSRPLVAGDVVTAQAKYGTTLLGAAATSATVAARTITVPVTADVTAVTGDNAAGLFARTNSAFAVQLLVKDTATTPAAKAGEVVKVAVTTSFGATTAGKTLSVNGTVSNATVVLPTALSVTTDAAGKAIVNLIPAGFAAGDTITVAYTVQNVTVSQTFAMADAAFSITDSQDETASANRAIAKGGTVSFNLEVKDQFGVAIAGSARIKTTPTINAVAGTASYTAVVAGKATVSLVDTQTAATPGNDSLKIELETQNASTLNWAASAFAGFGKTAVQNTAATSTVDVAVSATAPGFASSPTPAGAATKFTGTVTPVEYTAVTGVAGDNGVSLLNVAAGLATSVAGQKVTISGTGLLFRVGTKNYADTVTLFSGSAGAFAVTVYGKTAGDATVTLVTGTTTKTAVITFAAGAPVLASLVAPAQAQVGQALDIVVNVTDKWGNPVASAAANAVGSLTVSSTGTGYFASSALVANAAGKATVKYIVGTADIGTAYLSATLELGATDFTTAKSVEFGLTDGDVVAGGKRVFVSAEFAKGRTVSVSINGKRVYSKVQTTDNAVELAFTQRRKGTYTVTVRISGGITFTEKVTVG